MFMSLFGIAFMLLALALIAASIAWRQRLSSLVFGAGILCAVTIITTLYTGSSAIYDWTGINVYVAIILAIILLFAGGLGLIVGCVRLLLAWFKRRRKVSAIIG